MTKSYGNLERKICSLKGNVCYKLYRSTSKLHLGFTKIDVFWFWVHIFVADCYLLYVLQLFDVENFQCENTKFTHIENFFVKEVVESTVD